MPPYYTARKCNFFLGLGVLFGPIKTQEKWAEEMAADISRYVANCVLILLLQLMLSSTSARIRRFVAMVKLGVYLFRIYVYIYVYIKRKEFIRVSRLEEKKKNEISTSRRKNNEVGKLIFRDCTFS